MPYRIRNWTKFQHYKDRNPPWIKLHFSLLSSADWVTLDDASRVLAVASMLIASQNNGIIPDNVDYIRRVAYLNKPPNFKPLIDCGFIEKTLAGASTLQADASTLQADDSTLQADARPETETETETETEDDDTSVSSSARARARDGTAKDSGPKINGFDFDLWFSHELWPRFPRRVGKGHAMKAAKSALKRASPATILAGVEIFATSMSGREEQYIPHPSTWLNGDRWLDENHSHGANGNGHSKEGPASQLMRAAAEVVAERERARQDASGGNAPLALLGRDRE